MSELKRLGPIYDLMGLRLQDVDGGCGNCEKRLAEVIDDTTGQWNAGQVICVDCYYVAPAADRAEPWTIRGSWRAPGLRVAVCQLCRYTSMPSDLETAVRFAEQHLADKHNIPDEATRMTEGLAAQNDYYQQHPRREATS